MKKQHKPKLEFGLDFPADVQTLTPGCLGAKNVVPITGTHTHIHIHTYTHTHAHTHTRTRTRTRTHTHRQTLYAADVHDLQRARP